MNYKHLKLKNLNRPVKPGFSLVEILMTLVLVGLLSLVLSDLLVKGNSASSSLNFLFQFCEYQRGFNYLAPFLSWNFRQVIK